MKRACLLLTLAALLFCVPALADEAGVLTETELGSWLNGLLLSTGDTLPLNEPVGEDALTDDGYAFLYEDATLYYNKPVLDAQSVLNAVVVTDESLVMPRGIGLGDSANMLLAAYGWQNVALSGDDAFATLYVLNRLPNSAYWALAQRSGSTLQSVQCAIHANAGGDRYTDAGILYSVQEGVISAIRVYGLNTYITLDEVKNNLTAVGGSSAAAAVTGVTLVSEAEPFGQTDLQLNGMDFLTLTETGANALYGNPDSDNWAQDGDSGWLHTLSYPGVSLVFGLDANKQNARLESLSVTGVGVAGPRGLAVGATLADTLALFRCDGSGQTTGSVALLYGDGQMPPYGTLELSGTDATLRYAAAVANGAETVRFLLHLTFTNNLLTEMMLYTF